MTHKKPVSDRMREMMEDEEIIQNAMLYWFKEIRHPMNISEWILPLQRMKRDQIYREIWTDKKEYWLKELKLINTWEKKDFSIYKQELKKKLREWLKENAEKYLWKVFDNDAIEIKPESKARLALDILKSTDRDYNQSITSPVTINLWELPLWEWLEEAQRKLILELGITQDIFSQLEND